MGLSLNALEPPVDHDQTGDDDVDCYTVGDSLGIAVAQDNDEIIAERLIQHMLISDLIGEDLLLCKVGHLCTARCGKIYVTVHWLGLNPVHKLAIGALIRICAHQNGTIQESHASLGHHQGPRRGQARSWDWVDAHIETNTLR